MTDSYDNDDDYGPVDPDDYYTITEYGGLYEAGAVPDAWYDQFGSPENWAQVNVWSMEGDDEGRGIGLTYENPVTGDYELTVYYMSIEEAEWFLAEADANNVPIEGGTP